MYRTVRRPYAEIGTFYRIAILINFAWLFVKEIDISQYFRLISQLIAIVCDVCEYGIVEGSDSGEKVFDIRIREVEIRSEGETSIEMNVFLIRIERGIVEEETGYRVVDTASSAMKYLILWIIPISTERGIVCQWNKRRVLDRQCVILISMAGCSLLIEHNRKWINATRIESISELKKKQGEWDQRFRNPRNEQH